MSKVKTIILDGTEIAVKFEKGYPYYVIINMGDEELYASGSPGITAYADGVYTILPGMEIRISPELSADTVFLLGSGMVQVRAEEIAVPTSFNSSGKGGGSGGVTDYSLLENKPTIGGETVDGNKTLHDYGLPEHIDYNTLANRPVNNSIGIDNLGGKHTRNWYDLLCIQNMRKAAQCLLLISVYYDADTTESMLASIGLSSPKNTAKFQILSGMGTNIFDQVKITSDSYYLNSLYYWNVQFHLADSYANLNRTNIKVKVEVILDPKQFDDTDCVWWVFPNNSVPAYQETRFSMNLDVAKPFSYNDLRDKPTIPEAVTVDSALSETSENPVQNKVVTEALNSKLDSTDISDWAKADTKPLYTAEEVGADATGSASTALVAANSYTDVAITNLVGAAPDDLNTLEELAQAYKDNKDFAEILSAAITQKQNKLTKTVLYNTDSSPSPDWNELKEMSIRLVHVGNNLSDSYTHGLGGVYGYGVLSIFSDPSANANIVYQKYVTDVSNRVYMRSLYNNAWRNWKRIDAGAGVTGIKGEAETTYRTGNVNITKNDINLYKVFAYGYFTGKTIGEFKTEILEYINQQEHSPWTVDFEGDVIGKWNDDTNIISHGTNCKITPIGGYSDYQGGYIRCVLSTYTTTDSATYLFVVSAGQFSGLHRIITDEDITPEMIVKLKNL